MANPNATFGKRPLAGVIGFFDDPNALIAATRQVRDARFHRFDTYTPYPVHGLEAAQGLRRSPIPFVTFGAGVTGCLLAYLFQYWTSAIDWPIIVGGKPMNSWPAFVPIMFELTVLLGGLSTVGAMFAFNGLPNIGRRIFDPGLTRDRFAIVIEAPTNPEDEAETLETLRAKGREMRRFDEADATSFLKQVGAKEVRSVFAEGWF